MADRQSLDPVSGALVVLKDVTGGNYAPAHALVGVSGSSPAVSGVAGIGQGDQFMLHVLATMRGQIGSGATFLETVRIASIFKKIQAVAVTAGTPVSIWTPAASKKFRLLGWLLSLSVAGKILFEDTTGGANEFARTCLMAAGIGVGSPPLGNGYLSAAANNQLFIDVSATGAVDGIVFGTEE